MQGQRVNIYDDDEFSEKISEKGINIRSGVCISNSSSIKSWSIEGFELR